MKKESPKGFEYESKNLDYSSVESHICDYYDLGYADSSNFMELKPDGGQSITEILRQYFINHPQSIDKYTFLQNSAFTHWVKEKCSKMC